MKRQKKRTAGKRSTNAGKLSPNAISYTGPIAVPGGEQGTDLITLLCDEIVDISWPGGGLSTIFTQFSSVGTSTSYTSPYGEYREYRCLGMRVTCVPLYKSVQTNDTAAINSGYVMASSIEKTLNGTAYFGTTLANMVKSTSLEIHSSGNTFSREVRMNGTEEAAWGDTSVAGGVSQFSIGIIADTRVTHVPVQAAFATCFVKRLMQFRNKVQ